MRRKFIVGNWKMNHTIKEAEAFINEFDSFASSCAAHNIEVGIAPTYLCLASLASKAKHTFIFAQHVNSNPSGAYTGEISIPMLQEIGIKGSLVGHSERRSYYGETSERCNKKLKVLFENHMLPIYCVGESLMEYEANKSNEVVKEQVVTGLKGLKAEDVKNMVIAYEPVWSIGTGKNASSDIAQNICSFIRKTILEIYGEDVASSIRIQYGGSVKANNVKEYLSKDDIDGVLVGGASLEVSSFVELVKNVF